MTQQADSGISFVITRQVGVVTLNRPARRNAMDMPMRAALADTLDRALDAADVRALLLIGQGEHFCAGGDISAMPKADLDAGELAERMEPVRRIVQSIHASALPVVSAVDGCAYGGGFGLALLADYVLATPQARFCASFAKLGLVPDMGLMYTLPRVIGLGRARELVLSAREVGGEEACALGLAAELVPRDALRARALAVAAACASASPLAQALTRAGFARSFESTMAEMLDFEMQAQAQAFASIYHKDAAAAFLGRLPAAFQWPRLGR